MQGDEGADAVAERNGAPTSSEDVRSKLQAIEGRLARLRQTPAPVPAAVSTPTDPPPAAAPSLPTPSPQPDPPSAPPASRPPVASGTAELDVSQIIAAALLSADQQPAVAAAEPEAAWAPDPDPPASNGVVADLRTAANVSVPEVPSSPAAPEPVGIAPSVNLTWPVAADASDTVTIDPDADLSVGVDPPSAVPPVAPAVPPEQQIAPAPEAEVVPETAPPEAHAPAPVAPPVPAAPAAPEAMVEPPAVAPPSTELVAVRQPPTPPASEAPRWVMLALLATVAAIAVWIGAAGPEGYTSTARVAAVDELFFDYADANRDRMVGRVEADTEQIVIEPNGINGVVYVRPELQTFVDVEVTANDPQSAQTAANQLAQKMVDADLEALISPLDRRDAALADQLARLETEIAALDGVIEESVQAEAFAEANRWSGDADQLEELTVELRQAQDVRDRSNRRRAALSELVVELQAEREQIASEIVRYRAEGVVVRPAVLGTQPAVATNTLLAIVAFVGIMAAGAGLLVARRNGQK